MNSTHKQLIAFGIGALILILGVTLGALWTSILNRIVLNQLILSPSSKSFSMWKETPIPMYMELYLFNWTNPEEFGKSKAKPHFNQMGPYVFREIDSKVNKKWNDNGTVTFQQKRVWTFQPSMSRGKLSDHVTNLNPVAATIAYSMRHKNYFFKKLVNVVLNKLENKVITKTAGELLFYGYEDTMLKIAIELNYTQIPYSKFAWFYGRNKSETYDGTFNMLTGSENIHDLGKVKEWNFSNKSKEYYGSCGKIEGTNGDLWPPLIHNQTVSVFASDVCTSLKLVSTKSVEFSGLTGSKYVSNADMLDNGTNVPERSCYCHGVECQPSGTLNVSLCKFGAPAFISLPHFYLADEQYRRDISGMNPRQEDHEFYIVIEPNTGIPMQVNAQLQINFLVQSDNVFDLFKNVPKTYVPMLWFRQVANLTEDYSHQVKTLLLLPMIGHTLCFAIGGVGLLVVIVTAIRFIRCLNKSDVERESLINKKEESQTNIS